jgi:hypothetical protein
VHRFCPRIRSRVAIMAPPSKDLNTRKREGIVSNKFRGNKTSHCFHRLRHPRPNSSRQAFSNRLSTYIRGATKARQISSVLVGQIVTSRPRRTSNNALRAASPKSITRTLILTQVSSIILFPEPQVLLVVLYWGFCIIVEAESLAPLRSFHFQEVIWTTVD